MLTIGIPTYNRKYHVLSLAESLCGANLQDQVRLLIIDDGSSDGTPEALSQLFKDQRMAKCIFHSENQGYAATFVELFEKCETPYLLISSDDDQIVVSNVDDLLSELIGSQPNLISGQFMADGRIYRGKSRYLEIDPSEFFGCSAHAPGIVYRVEACRKGVSDVSKLLAAHSEVAAVYPQVLIVASALCSGRCYWWPKPLVTAGAQLPTGIKSVTGEQYYYVASRWRQLREFETYFTDLLHSETRSFAHDKIERMRRDTRSRVYGMLRAAIEAEVPEMLEEFDKSVMRHSIRLYAKSTIRKLLNK